MAYTSLEEQEINEIKSWWNENYKMIITVAVLSFAGAMGWRYWQEHKITQAQNLSMQYDEVVLSNQSADTKNAKIDAFVQANSKTSYAVLALLDKAKIAVDNKDFSLAATTLQQAASEASDETLASIANIRLAAIQIQQQEFDAALVTLNQVKDSAWNVRKQMLTGDIQLAKGDKAAAKTSYENAQKDANLAEQQWLKVRLNNL